MFKHWRSAGARLARLTLVSLLPSAGCSYYSPDLLGGALGEGGTASGSVGSSSTSGGSERGAQGGASGTRASNGGSDAGTATDRAGSTAAGGTGTGSTGTGSTGAGSTTAGGNGDVTNTGAAAGAGGSDLAGAGGVDPGPTDACPADPNKVSPGKCGCGVPEICADLKAGLAHRYSFDLAGMVAKDSIGTADGTIVAAAASAGKLSFDGTAVAYVDLPNGLVSSLHDASFEIWLQWGGGAIWQRIFDFGTNDQGENLQGAGTSYLFLTPSDGSSGKVLRSSFSLNGVGSETVVKTPAPLPTDTMQHIVLVADDTNNELRIYLNGAVAALSGWTQSLSSLSDLNNWIGRSNSRDAPLKATIEEVRIYKIALDQAHVTASHDFGPNPSFL
jgi:hypothetical protein